MVEHFGSWKHVPCAEIVLRWHPFRLEVGLARYTLSCYGQCVSPVRHETASRQMRTWYRPMMALCKEHNRQLRAGQIASDLIQP